MLIQPKPIGTSGGSGVSTYIDLTDTPSSYYARRSIRYNAAGTGVSYSPEIPFYIEDYGGVADGNEVSDGAITSGTGTLNSASNRFTSADVGKSVVVTGAGSAGGQLSTTISAYVNAGQLTLAANASTTVSNSQVSWGTDSTAAIQAAIDAASLNRYGKIVLTCGRWFTTGVLDFKRLPDGVNITRSSVTFVGEVQGPFEARSGPLNYSPGQYDVAPVLMITNMSTPFMSFNAINVVVDSIMFYYPNQIRVNTTGAFVSTTTTPVVYPFTLYPTNLSSGVTIKNCILANSYDAIKAYGSRCWYQNLLIGKLNIGFEFDFIWDVTRVSNIHFGPYYDLLGGWGSLDSHMQNWIISQPTSWFFVIKKADQLMLNDIFGISSHGGLKLTYGAQGGSYGNGTNIHFEGVAHGIWANDTGAVYVSWDFVNYTAAGVAEEGYYLYTEGARGVNITIQNGRVWGSFIGAKVSHNNTNGRVIIQNVVGYNPVGTTIAPSLPASGVAYTVRTPHKSRINIYGGTVTAIAIGGAATGLTSGSFVLSPGETITLTYSSAPSWTWFGL